MDQIHQKVNEVATVLEQAVDEELERLDKLTVSDYENLREERLKALKKKEEQRRNWLSQGHGTYSELSEEKSFFDVMKNSDRVVYHFYRDGAERCKIVDMHLKILAAKHVETRFVSLNAPKCPFLTARLNIKVIPTLLIAVGQKTVDRIVGFTDLGNRDDFDTDMLEWRLAKGRAIHYDGDILTPPSKNKKKIMTVLKKKTIRGGTDSDTDSDLSD